MISKIKKNVQSLYDIYYFYVVTRSWKTRYKNVSKDLFINNLEDYDIKNYQKKWSKFGHKVEIETFLLCYNLSGVKDYNIVPENIFAAFIEKRLNKHKESSFFSLKNVYHRWYNNSSVFPYAYFHKIDDIYYDNEFNIIDNIDAFINKTVFNFPIILKASKDTYGGIGVRIIEDKRKLYSVIDEFNYFVCQEKLQQNHYLAQINDSSLNTVRACLYRKNDGKFEVLNNSIRFGVNGSLDNETGGGLVCNINDNGLLNEYAVDKFANKYFKHPNSNIEFKSVLIPFYDKLLEQSQMVANDLLLCNLVSLDMSLDSENNWRCIEVNVSGQTIRFAQYAGKSFFGKFTDEIIDNYA